MKKKGNEKKIIILTVLLFLSLLYFCVNLLKLKTVQAVSIENNEIQSVLINKNPLNLDEILNSNKENDIREEMNYEKNDLEYTTKYIKNEDLPSGTIHVSQIGINGIQDVISIKRYKGDELISEKIVASNVKKASVDKIVEIGVGKRKK